MNSLASPLAGSARMHAHRLQRRTPHTIPGDRLACRVARPQQQHISVQSAQELALDFAAAAQHPADTAPFAEPFIRSLLLGISAGGFCEAVHVAFKTLATEAGSHDLPAAADLAPLWMADHAVAIGAWVLLYLLEVAAVAAVVRQVVPADMLERLRSLPRRMLPVKLDFLKRWISKLVRRQQATITPALAAAAAAPAPAAVVVAAPEPPAASVTQPAADTPPLAPAVLEARGGVGLGSISMTGSTTGSMLGSVDEAALNEEIELERQRQQLGRTGKWDPRTSLLTRRERELADRKSYLKNFWYAAALSDNLQLGKPLGVDILGMRVVLFRDESTGGVACIDDTCPHRGAPLSEGWLKTDAASGHTCVVCPYHGWAFDGDGRLRDVPSAAKPSWPKRPIVNKFPVEERGGFVWLFYGDASLPADERPPIPYIPELEDANWRAVYGELEFDAPHWPVFENAIDMAHIHYLHSFGNADKPGLPEMKFDRDTFSVSGAFNIYNKPPSKMWEWTATPSVPVTATAMLPSTSAVTIQLGAGVRMITFVNTVPIDEHRSINRFCLIRNFATWPGFDGFARREMYKILAEDKVMVEKLAADRLPQEYSLSPDGPQIAFRQLRQEWIDMGYGVAPADAARARKPGLPASSSSSKRDGC